MLMELKIGGNIMEIKRLEANYSYDYRLDVINIEVKEDYKYELSIDLEAGVYLHFDENYFPVGLEIIDASKKMAIEKDFLLSPNGKVEVTINDDSINVNVIFENNNEKGLLHLNTFSEPYIPSLKTDFALV